uniref:Uncharacterized protein n=1 Tax=Caenorhabditis japonica TaxID=281687 RepID=A0A8R1E5L3_CAEJA
MSPPSRKKRQKGQDSPTTEVPEDQVHFAPGRHTGVSHEDELLLATDGSKQPLRDTPVSSLATPAVAPASYDNFNIGFIPVSTPVYTSGHPSAVSSISQMSTSDVETAAQRPNSQWEEDYDNKTDVSCQEECVPPFSPPPNEKEETAMPSMSEPEFSMPVTIHGVRVPVKQKRHPFDGLYAPR